MTKITYVKCPRCDLNYIDSRLEMCDICKAELNLSPSSYFDDDDIKELCPIEVEFKKPVGVFRP